jgi:hypothetical protein
MSRGSMGAILQRDLAAVPEVLITEPAHASQVGGAGLGCGSLELFM